MGGPGPAASCGALPQALETIARIFYDKRILEPGDASKSHLLSALQMGKLRYQVLSGVSELQSQELLQGGTRPLGMTSFDSPQMQQESRAHRQPVSRLEKDFTGR